MESKYNSTEKIISEICSDKDIDCLKDLDFAKNIYSSGIDLAYKVSFAKIGNMFSDYKKVNNKTDIQEINSTLINSKTSDFSWIEMSLSNLFFYVQEKIYYYFELDIEDFTESFSSKIKLFNVISIIFCIFIFILTAIFFSFWIFVYSKSIKESSYRINCSFYYIKRYSINI